MFAGHRVIRDDSGNIIEWGRKIEGRCCMCPGKNKRLTSLFCLCGENPLKYALDFYKRAPRGKVKWICYGHDCETGQVSCMATHFCMAGQLEEQEEQEEDE